MFSSIFKKYLFKISPLEDFQMSFKIFVFNLLEYQNMVTYFFLVFKLKLCIAPLPNYVVKFF